jgi:hypothetical protein
MHPHGGRRGIHGERLCEHGEDDGAQRPDGEGALCFRAPLARNDPRQRPDRYKFHNAESRHRCDGLPVVQLPHKRRWPGDVGCRHPRDERLLQPDPVASRSAGGAGLPDAPGGRLHSVSQSGLEPARRGRAHFKRQRPFGRRSLDDYAGPGSLPAGRDCQLQPGHPHIYGPYTPAPALLCCHAGFHNRALLWDAPTLPALVVPDDGGYDDLPGCGKGPPTDWGSRPISLLRHPEDRGCRSAHRLRGGQPPADRAHHRRRAGPGRPVEILLEQHGERRVREQVHEVVHAAL